MYVTNGKGLSCVGQLIVTGKKSADIQFIKGTEKTHIRKFEINLAVGLSRDNAFETLLRQSVEMGISKIIPVSFENSTLSTTIFNSRIDRFERILETAVEQTRAPFIPEIMPLHTPPELINENFFQKGFLFHEDASLFPSGEDFNSICKPLILIGPEGGITEGEVELLSEGGFLLRRLPGNILKVDTACLSASTIVSYNLSIN